MVDFAGRGDFSGGEGSVTNPQAIEISLFVLFGLIVALFNIFPAADIEVSRLFYSGANFPLSHSKFLIFIRDLNRQIPVLVISYFAFCLARCWFRPGLPSNPPPHLCLYVLLSYALGPGLCVQVMKTVFARSRPHSIFEFGGSHDFTRAAELFGTCKASCAFISGEAASAMAMLCLLAAVPQRMRKRAAAVLVSLAVLFSVNRIVFGAHFLSDVLSSWVLIGLIMLILWRLISARADTIDSRIQGYMVGRFQTLGRR
ncbi:phosphatase PAP2 family protein [Oryzifoliimicrobium ureilyticus]|uniref:phosphatase PAP2 family protein n=1 Tax=Oryzifoliimicrobium ureilyticus TaxID=3113724 RepID=UPI0030763176